MDYPAHSISHNWPLVILFGLGTPDPTASDEVELQYPLLQEGGFQVSSDLPDVTGPAAEDLLNCFLEFDAQDAAWNNRPGKGKIGTMGFTFRSVGRSIRFPPHKAAALELPGSQDQDGEFKQAFAPVLHSPISPLTPGSPTFPDGLMTSLWFTKHQVLLPSTLVAFFNFTLDEGKSTLNDNRLKSEINAIRSSVTSSGYKIHVAVVLMTEDQAENSGSGDSLQDRLANIRGATSLDAKYLHLISRNATEVELRAFVGGVLSSIQPSCIEYYRDLSKHARRKRNRSSIPPPTASPTSGTSRTLSAQDWNVRYETKMGFFAEFRQEMDAACRNYEAAYEGLFGGTVFGSTTGWSLRFDEARLLGDILAIRIIRCLLWNNLSTSAVASWSNHRSRVQELIDRRGKGNRSYGWEAWEARWAKTMAEIVDKVDLPVFHIQRQIEIGDGTQGYGLPTLYANPEKSYSNEQKLLPWNRLHHPGYWFNLAASHTRQRRRLALDVPVEDRTVPLPSSDTPNADRNRLYDMFLCPDPSLECGTESAGGTNHGALIVTALDSAAREFSLRQQFRTTERIQLEIAQEYVAQKRWHDAMDVLQPLWESLSWKESGWWQLVNVVSRLIRDCARETFHLETLIRTEWGLLCKTMTDQSTQGTTFTSCLDTIKEPHARPLVNLKFEETAPTVTASFAFRSTQGNVGIFETAQLVICSNAHSRSTPIVFSRIDLIFEGGLRDSRIIHSSEVSPLAKNASKGLFELYDHSEGKDSNVCYANMEFSSNQIKAFLIKLLPREAGDVQAVKAKLRIEAKAFDFELQIPLQQASKNSIWWYLEGQSLARKMLNTDNASAIRILPKPPKLELSILELRKIYYVGENVELEIQIVNREEDSVDVRLSVSLSNSREPTPTIHWDGKNESTKSEEADLTPTVSSQPEELILMKLSPSEVRAKKFTFQSLADPAEFFLYMKADYHLISDPDTPLSKTAREKMTFIRSFETNYDFKPGIYTDSWPSYFHVEQYSESKRAVGLKQLWNLNAKIASLGVDTLILDESSLQVIEAKVGANCIIHPSITNTEPVTLQPREAVSRSFPFEVQKTSLEDRRSAIVGFQLEVVWHREEQPQQKVRTLLLVPPLTVPFGEPRVLVSACISKYNPGVINLTYTLENPSTHFLSFSLTMETSEDFAFSGPKIETTQLIPLSRQSIRYNLLPFQQKIWIRPAIRVVDTGFGQELRPVAADGCSSDKKGVLIWVKPWT